MIYAERSDGVKSAAIHDGVAYVEDAHSVRRIDAGVAHPIS
jgi:hypothetical protein